MQRREASSRLSSLAVRLGRELDGRCCEAIAAATGEVPAGTAVLVVDARGTLVASAGAAAAPDIRIEARRTGDRLGRMRPRPLA